MHYWINELESINADETLPALGFGVSRDDNACKMYVMNQKGQTLPRFPLLPGTSSESAKIDAILPSTANKNIMVSLEWKIGQSAVAVRQYAVEEHASSLVGQEARSNEERISTFGNDGRDLTGPLSDLLLAYGGATEDVPSRFLTFRRRSHLLSKQL